MAYQPPKLIYTFNYGKGSSFDNLYKELEHYLEKKPMLREAHFKVEFIPASSDLLTPQERGKLEHLISTHNASIQELSEAEWNEYCKKLLK